MHRGLRSVLPVAAALAVAADGVAAQDVERVSARLIQEVMPDADRFDEAGGNPPVKRAYRGEELIGYVFVTSDLPPEEQGFSGPIRALVGVDTAGVLTGVRVTRYRESYRYEMGDFLGTPWFLEQFVDKDVGDPFSPGYDVDGMSQVTISVRALARGVRDAARRVVLAYSEPPAQPPEGLPEAELVELSWYEMQRRGIAVTMSVTQRRRSPFQVSLVYVSSDELARRLMGRRYESFTKSVERAGGADDIVLYVVGGAGFVSALRTGWSIEQNGRTLEIPRERVVNVGTPGGALSGQASQVGALLLDDEDGVDLTQPLTFAFDRGRPELGTFQVEYTGRAAPALVAEGTPAEEEKEAVAAARAPSPEETEVRPPPSTADTAIESSSEVATPPQFPGRFPPP
jgi:Na+-translocating ferredoxin:NAD+ oxidoreductase RnfG subunit